MMKSQYKIILTIASCRFARDLVSDSQHILKGFLLRRVHVQTAEAKRYTDSWSKNSCFLLSSLTSVFTRLFCKISLVSSAVFLSFLQKSNLGRFPKK